MQELGLINFGKSGPWTQRNMILRISWKNIFVDAML